MLGRIDGKVKTASYFNKPESQCTMFRANCRLSMPGRFMPKGMPLRAASCAGGVKVVVRFVEEHPRAILRVGGMRDLCVEVRIGNLLPKCEAPRTEAKSKKAPKLDHLLRILQRHTCIH